MVNVIHRSASDGPPELGDDDRWVFVESDSNGRFRGVGYSWKASGEGVGYRSLSEDDGDLERALAAAMAWASKYAVPTIWVIE